MPREAVISRDGFPRGRDAVRGQVAVVAVRHRPLDGVYHVLRRLKSKRHGISDIEVANAHAAGLNRPCLGNDVADRIRKAVDPCRDGNRSRCLRRQHSRSILHGALPPAFDELINYT